MSIAESAATPVVSENTIVPDLKPILIIAVTPPFARIDDVAHRHREMQQYFPTPVVQQRGFRADLCATTSGFCRYERFQVDWIFRRDRGLDQANDYTDQLTAAFEGPSMVTAYLKLRRRNLAPLLDANGWAVNTKAMINLPFGASLTHVAKLPPGAERPMRDPYSQHRTPWNLYATLTLLLIVFGYLWEEGYIAKWRDHVVTKVEQAAQ